MLPSENWAPAIADDLVEHLRSRTMAGLPHIGVLGSKSAPETDQPSDIEEDEYTQPTDTDEGSPLYPDWKFVPNKMSYQVTVRPTNGSLLRGAITFFLRLREGCDSDLGSELDDRPKEYCLGNDELLGAFRKYELAVTSSSLSEQPVIELRVDGAPVQLERKQLTVDMDRDAQEISVVIEDNSDVFLCYEESKARLARQHYRVVYKRHLTAASGVVTIRTGLINESPRTPRSSIPTRERDKESGKLEEEQDWLSRNVGRDTLRGSYSPRLFAISGLRNNPGGSRYGYLMEVEMAEEISSSAYPYTERDAANTINCILDDSHLRISEEVFEGKLAFKDHALFEEYVPQMSPGPGPTELFAKLRLDENLRAVFEDDLGFTSFHLFQAASIGRIVDAMRKSAELGTVVISARTAGGKTEAFLVPITQYCIENRTDKGVKALVFYPTKALANDQANRYIEILYHLNRRLDGRKITLGMLHGDVSRLEPEPGSEDDWDLPLSCPKCKEGVLRFEDDELVCNACHETIDFVKVRDRQQVYSDPPDILITNPDTIIWDMMMRPQNHSIFGRPTYVCNDCGWTYVAKGRKRRCDNERCRGSNLAEINPTVPRFIVFDEVHMFKGTFGINCSYFISRLQGVLRRYSTLFHNNPTPKFVRIGSSATISNPLEFAEDFFDVPREEVVLVPKDREERRSFYRTDNRDETIRRHHVYIMPYAYNTDSTIGRTIHYIQARSKIGTPPTRLLDARQPLQQYLQTITFVNSIRSSNNLIALTRRTVANDLPDLRIDGHTTDFDRKSRARIERAFNRNELHCIFATQTLEVGVDFRRVDVVVVNGFPFSFNDYLQRIGRGGRKRDSLVITVCQNWMPIDHYYFSNAREALRDPASHMEPVPITRNNIRALEKHAKGALFDYIVSDPDLQDYVNDFRSFAGVSETISGAVSYCAQALGKRGVHAEDLSTYLSQFGEYLADLARNEIGPVVLFKRFNESINKEHQLTSLRSTDREVMIEVLWSV